MPPKRTLSLSSRHPLYLKTARIPTPQYYRIFHNKRPISLGKHRQSPHEHSLDFFTPKSSLRHGGRIGTSRRVLRDITATGSNRKNQRKTEIDTGQAEPWSDPGATPRVNKRKRYTPPSPATTVDFSSPLKRVQKKSLDILDDHGSSEEVGRSEDEDDYSSQDGSPRAGYAAPIKPITYSRYRASLGQGLRREIGDHARVTWSPSASSRITKAYEHQHETADFYTKPVDAHDCYNISTPSSHTIPFCTASCNSKYSIEKEILCQIC